MEQEQVLDQLMGNYRYLVDAQVFCAGSYDNGSYICNKDQPGERRILGSWDSYIIPVAVNSPFPLRYLDSNLFVTTQTLFPLFFIRFDDPNLEQQRRDTIYKAMTAVNLFRRNDGFAFWPQVGPSIPGQVNRIGPLNLSPLLLSAQLRIVSATEDFVQIPLFPENVRWMQRHLDLDNDEIGIDVMFNVPNDADDTAFGIAANIHFYRDHDDKSRLDEFLSMTGNYPRHVDTHAARSARRFRSGIDECRAKIDAQVSDAERRLLFSDEWFLRNCSLDDPRERWRHSAYDDGHSGAFLTWLYDETRPIYDDPENGVSLPGQNSVDCNAIANVVYALQVAGVSDDPEIRPGYVNSCNAISNVILDRSDSIRMSENPRNPDAAPIATWKSCGLFFPAHMTFPYLVSKAVSEAGACRDLPAADQDRFDTAMIALLGEITAEQDQDSELKQSGQWFEPIDESVELPTLMGGVSLLHFAHAYGEVHDLGRFELQQRIEDAIQHSISSSSTARSATGDTLASMPEGTYFGGGTVNEIAHWRSAPFATAVSLELMTKYLLAYSGLPSDGRTLVIESPHQANANPVPEQRLLRPEYIQDSLPPLVQSGHDFAPLLRAKSGNRGEEIIVGGELSVGRHFRGEIQEPVEKVALYKVKLRASGGFDFDTNSLDHYSLNASFAGISTYTDFVIRDDVAHFPLSHSSQDNVLTTSAHWRYGQLSAPVFKLAERIHVNVDLTGRIAGYVRRSYARGDSPNRRESFNLMDFSAGLTLISHGLSAGAFVETALGYSTDSDGNNYSSHRNYSLGGSIRYAFNRQHSISFTAIKTVDGGGKDLFDDDRTYLSYEFRHDP